MKKIIMLVLVLLIGSYTAVYSQTGDTTKTEEATKDFLGLKWGAGVGVIGGLGGDSAVEKASIVNGVVRVDEEGDLRPQLFLEMHVFLRDPAGKVKAWRQYQPEKAVYQMKVAKGVAAGLTPPTAPDPPLIGFGPFIALQSGDNKAIDALSLGVMWGFRRDPEASNSLNIGFGISFDPSVQVLGGGFKEDKAPPPGETAVRFKKEGQFGWVLMTSFTF